MLGATQAVLIGIQRDEGGGGWLPSDLTSIHHWLDFTDLSTMWEEDTRTTPASIDSPVGSIYDQALADYWEQPDSGTRPVVNGSGTGVTFNPTTDPYLGISVASMTWMLGAAQNSQIFAIADQTALGGNQAIVVNAFSAANYELMTNNNDLQVGVSADLKTTPTSTGLHLSEICFDNVGDILSAVLDNGTPASRGSIVAYNPNVNDKLFTVGATSRDFGDTKTWGFDGDIKEIIFVESVTTDERNSLMGYFNAKYSMSL